MTTRRWEGWLVAQAWWEDGYHPFWSCLRLAVVLTVLIIASKITATNFDETELRLICAVALGAAGAEFLAPIFRKMKQ